MASDQEKHADLNGAEGGQALVELAVTMPLLLLILFGAMEFARFAYVAIEVSNAARAAAQYAAMNGGAAADATGVTNAAQGDSQNLFTPKVTATVTGDTCVCSLNESSPVSCKSTCATGRILETVTVQTSANYAPLFTVPSFSSNVSSFSSGITMKGYAKQLVLP